MVRGHFTKQSLAAASSLAALLALAPVAAAADPSVPPVGPGVCIQVQCYDGSYHECGFDCTSLTRGKSGSSGGSSGSSGASSAAARAAKRAAKLARQRQHQIQANNFRLRSIDRARSKLTYPSIENFFRSPSIDEQWQQGTQSKIQSLGRLIAAKKARIKKILGNRPLNWNGSVRPPGKEPDYPFFSKGSKDSAPVALGNKAPTDLPTVDPSDLKGGQEPASYQASIVRFDALSPQPNPFAWKGATQESTWQKLKKGTYFGTEIGEDSAQWWADHYVATDSLGGKVWYGGGGLLSSLWTPDTYLKTSLTLGIGAYAGTLLEAPTIIGTTARVGATARVGVQAGKLGVPRVAAKPLEQIARPGYLPPRNVYLRADQLTNRHIKEVSFGRPGSRTIFHLKFPDGVVKPFEVMARPLRP